MLHVVHFVDLYDHVKEEDVFSEGTNFCSIKAGWSFQNKHDCLVLLW